MESDLGTDRHWPLWLLLHRTSYAMRRAREIELQKFGLSDIQAAVIFLVKEAETALTPAEIARRLFREAHTVSALLGRMEKQGLVKKIKDQKRKNQIRIELAPDGEKAYAQAKEMKSIGKIMSSLTGKKQEKLWEHLETLLSKAHSLMMLKYESPLIVERPWSR
ncbi:MAG: MarR family transcriptional regulator [Chloroflexi bacterium]|jgi:DNA-binding MarR family transcriptional regulator|nr:MarR family transcriptional regulator [Chloroflexota bacterium]MBT7082528.1 MarR family transcriptional regulator [Chloroflexota bacterium]MBT7289617.1 MarR family transcriptional regulator [Chloroflexota bacterium]